MSLDLAEFHRSLSRLARGLPLEDGQTDFIVPADNAQVRIIYEQLEKVTFGGLLTLPRARVTLHLGGLDEAERHAFLTRFEQAFRRGGG